MMEIFKFYVQLISDCISKFWGGLPITEEVSYLYLFVAVMVLLVFIKLLRLSFENHGLMAVKRFNDKRQKEFNKTKRGG